MPSLIQEIFACTRSEGFQQYLATLLVELCGIDTTPNPDIEKMRAAEDACFRILEREIGGLLLPGLRLERRPINPAIQSHPHYSLLHFTKTPERPQGLSPEETYAHRSNLVCIIPATRTTNAGQSIALNAHVDVVAPFSPPRVKGNLVLGRGACDDKGPVVSIVAALKVLSEVMHKAGLAWNRNVLAMFVIEEETGGNGSLSLATDRELKSLYDSILVAECCGLSFHPANRGAVWYRAELCLPDGVSSLETFAFINEEMEKEGAAIRAESRHDLFPQRPVQTCHGILGPFGEHPSRICGEVGFWIVFERSPDRKAGMLLQDCLDSGLTNYIGLYGDKTKVTDPGSGKPMVERHYKLERVGNAFQVRVYGSPGHMGVIRERDGAITKTAHLVRSLVASKMRLASAAGEVTVQLSGAGPAFVAETALRNKGDETIRSPAAGREDRLSVSVTTCPGVFEGGQGFLPTHDVTEEMDRLRAAAQRGAENYLRRIGRRESGSDVVKVSYEKLHNVAFDGAADSATVQNAIESAKITGLWADEPILGWTVSCDARLFATEYPGMDVLTFGPGQLAFAHSDQEQITVDEVRKAAEFLAVFLLRQTGTFSTP